MADTSNLPSSLRSKWNDLADECLASGRFDEADLVSAARRLMFRATPTSAWPMAGGECGALLRERDWSQSPLGPVERWSQELRATAANIVNSPVAKVLMWGSDHIMLYNDAYIGIAGAKHPAALGGRVPAVWPELWDWNRSVTNAFAAAVRPSGSSSLPVTMPDAPN